MAANIVRLLLLLLLLLSSKLELYYGVQSSRTDAVTSAACSGQSFISGSALEFTYNKCIFN
jgi:hypothetical protein